MQTVVPDIGAGMHAALQSTLSPPAETVLTTLLNDITARPDNFVLVLDDYHVIDAKQVDDAVGFLRRACDAPRVFAAKTTVVALLGLKITSISSTGMFLFGQPIFSCYDLETASISGSQTPAMIVVAIWLVGSLVTAEVALNRRDV